MANNKANLQLFVNPPEEENEFQLNLGDGPRRRGSFVPNANQWAAIQKKAKENGKKMMEQAAAAAAAASPRLRAGSVNYENTPNSPNGGYGANLLAIEAELKKHAENQNKLIAPASPEKWEAFLKKEGGQRKYKSKSRRSAYRKSRRSASRKTKTKKH